MYGMDVLEGLSRIPDESVHCVVTSPPYWALRDYKVAGQIGLEDSPEEFVDRVVQVFQDVKRVLRPDGTLWINLGDSYNAQAGQQNLRQSIATTRGGGVKCSTPNYRLKKKLNGALKPKDLVGIPWMVAFALRADGWYLRSEIIWAKPNPMPESVTDRPTKAHETVFLFSKSSRYFYNADAVREPLKDASIARLSQENLINQQGSDRANGGAKTNGRMKAVLKNLPAAQANIRALRNRQRGKSWNDHKEDGVRGNRIAEKFSNPLGANRKTVWNIPTQPYSKAHFATFPEELPEICIKAGSPAGGLVLDPFCGSGTTGKVSVGLGRRFIGIDLNKEYLELAKDRIGLFACV